MQYGGSVHPKVAYFYADGSSYGEGVRVVIQPNRFRSWEALLEFLTTKFPDLPYGVRSVFSLRGRKRIHSIAELNDDVQGFFVGGGYWLVRITTGRRDAKVRSEYTSACTANVFLTVQGTKSTSAALNLSMHRSRPMNGANSPSNKASKNNPLGRDTKPLFSPGQTDEFEVNLGDIGDVVKVRLSHDKTGNYPELLVSHMRMTRLPGAHASMNSGHLRDGIVSSASSHSLAEPNLADLTFYFNAWLSQNVGDGQVTREVASRGSLGLILQEQRRRRHEALKRPQGITPVLPVTKVPKLPMDDMLQLPTVQYHVRVKTSNLWDSGTTAAVMVLLFGQFGDSGPRHLWNRQSAKRRPFQQGQVDDFKFHCVILGRLNLLKVWLDSSPRKTPETWCLEWIQVIEEDDPISSISSLTSTIIHQPPALFHGDQWLYLEPVVNALQMLPVAQPVDLIFGPNGESDYGFPATISKLWKSMEWMFKNGMEISFYSLVTGDPLSLMSCGRIKSIKSTTDSPCGKFLFYMFPFPLKNTDKSNSESGGPKGFLIRPHLNGFIQVESVLLRDNIEQVLKFRVDPSDGSISIGETADHRETLLMPYVKGSMRDQGIILLCTNSEQTLTPYADGQVDGNLVAKATGTRTNESHWRVHRVGQQIRAFESVAYCGYYLKITEGSVVDVMGRGDSDCYFVVMRERRQGYIRLESQKFPSLFLHINSNGTVTSSNSVDNKCNRFYPLIVECKSLVIASNQVAILQ
ncbi:unnamed protein product [Taenia asiatica]|uniref:Doublecortin domain-containing protein n=1 Tax=Taenia asiatica TaxID=60517 RepID=A0A158R9M5_TAEAS|nr:unnamed protein product [Taenia asiatica]